MIYYAVFGNPISQSRSPTIHTLFSKQFKFIVPEYHRILVPIREFRTYTSNFFKVGKGINVTAPFKQEAASMTSYMTDRAREAGAVNFLSKLSNGKLLGDNTDGYGLLQDLNKSGFPIVGKTILILGSGGATRGIIGPLLRKKPSFITIASRDESRAYTLLKRFNYPGRVGAYRYDDLIKPFDIIINATSAQLSGELAPLSRKIIKKNHTLCYDLSYGHSPNLPTIFSRWAKDNGARLVLDGLGMLVEQAAESFFLWHGVRPNTRLVLEHLRSEKPTFKGL